MVSQTFPTVKGYSPKVMLTADIALSIWRHWAWSDRMRELFLYYLKDDFSNLPPDFLEQPSFWVSSMVTTMALWYALLYVTCEAIEKEAGIDMQTISADYPKVSDRLRRFRNATFHVQSEFWSSKIMEILKDPETATTISSVHKAVEQWLRSELRKLDVTDNLK
jgi:hypothetical protein